MTDIDTIDVVEERRAASTARDARSMAIFWGWTLALSAIFLGAYLLFEAFLWARFGQPNGVALSEIIPMPHVGWVGIQRVFDFIWGLDLFWVLGVGVLASSFLHDAYDRDAKPHKRPS